MVKNWLQRGPTGDTERPEAPMTSSLLPQPASLLPQELAFSSGEDALFDELYEAAELDAVCEALFGNIGPGAPLP